LLKSVAGANQPESQFYSQQGEDRILARLFPGDQAGTCVDVGAHDGIQFSNSYYFEQIGWRCVLIEPAPKLCAAIRENRRSLLFECAASEAEGEAVLHWVEGADLYSTVDADDSSGADTWEIRVRTRRLDDILTEAGVARIDFISIDVEGHEMSVLRGFSIERWKPRIVIIEDNSNLSDSSVLHFMEQHSYLRFYRTGVNDWYAAPGEWKLRNPLSLALSGKWGVKGLAKVWLPARVRKLVTALPKATCSRH
jgi:FkbM family methyltransferase